MSSPTPSTLDRTDAPRTAAERRLATFPSEDRTGTRLPMVLAVVIPACLALLVAAAALARGGEWAFVAMLRDTAATLDVPFYIGLVSNVGILLWGASTSICLLAASVPARTARARRDARFFLAAAGASAWLLADDALLLHEQVFPDYLGLPGELSLGIGLGATAGTLLVFRHTVRASDVPLLVAALSFLAASAGMDRLHDLGLLGPLVLHSDAFETLIEDSLKLFGIALWTSYFALTVRDRLVLRDGGRTAAQASPP